MREPIPAPKPRRTIRFWLNCLAFACVLPGVLVSAWTITRSFQHDRAELEHDTVAMARALCKTVDTELSGFPSAMTVLSHSTLLDAENLSAFHDQASKVVRAIDGNTIVLADRTGHQWINTLKPFGEPLPIRSSLDQLRRGIDTQEPAISDLFIGSVPKQPAIAIDVPGIRNGSVVYALTIVITPERLRDILKRQQIPADWTVGIVDASSTIVAR